MGSRAGAALCCASKISAKPSAASLMREKNGGGKSGKSELMLCVEKIPNGNMYCIMLHKEHNAGPALFTLDFSRLVSIH
jgi:hypothetical protein